ncbi:MAG: E3 binding domain-containing protein, partial [Anaerolineales bacterium]|nr:E3 binding domain-containing protein [Anaerolineales bacterium]
MAKIVNMPKLGFDMAEGTLVRWVVSEQEAVEKGQVLAEIETDKATVEVESPFSGVVRRHLVEQDAIVPVSMPIAVIGESDEEIDFDSLLAHTLELETAEDDVKKPETAEEKAPAEPIVAEEVSAEAASLPDGVRASPLARRMAGTLGIDLRQVQGSGPGGRITKADIEAFQVSPRVTAAGQAAVFPAVSGEIPDDRNIPLSKLRTAIGKRMAQSKVEFPQFFVTHEYDV